MLAFFCACKQMTDPFSSVTGKQYFALHLTGQSNELNTLPRLSRRLVSFLLFNFFPISSLHPFLLSAMSSMFALALCWKTTTFQSHGGQQQQRPQEGCWLFHHHIVWPQHLVTLPWLLHRHCIMVENAWAFYTMSELPITEALCWQQPSTQNSPWCAHIDAGAKNALFQPVSSTANNIQSKILWRVHFADMSGLCYGFFILFCCCIACSEEVRTRSCLRTAAVPSWKAQSRDRIMRWGHTKNTSENWRSDTLTVRWSTHSENQKGPAGFIASQLYNSDMI